MTRAHEKLLIAALAGFVIAGAAAFVVSPILAAGIPAERVAQIDVSAPIDMSNF